MIREKSRTMDTFSVEKLMHHLRLYEGCGNMLGIAPLTLAGYPPGSNWLEDRELRKFLYSWGLKIHSDSVMVLTGDPQNPSQTYDFFMDVYEPSGTDATGEGLAGGVSTMCGNGIRAVAAYARTFNPDITVARIMSRSGLRTVGIDRDRNLYAVDMGEFTSRRDDLSQYVQSDLVGQTYDGTYIESPIPAEIYDALKQHVSATMWSIGLTGDRNASGCIDGEPHVVINVPRDRVSDIQGLRRLAVAAGPIVTKALSCFPFEISANFIVVAGKEDGKLVVWNCTHERNLGSDSDHSVTAACGTGSTVVGAIMFLNRPTQPDNILEVHNTGGILEISQHPKTRRLILTGPANPVPLE
ncbi:hypothetical protein HY041_00855 [Candidatus Roizmanbacteria bacterium]|nr:hypothetical protein [Candidatus Roizmanbacteria bacterium]